MSIALLIICVSMSACDGEQQRYQRDDLLATIPAETSYIAQITYRGTDSEFKARMRAMRRQGPIYRRLLGAYPTRQLIVSLFEGFASRTFRDKLSQIGVPTTFEASVYGLNLWPVYTQEVSDLDAFMAWVSEKARKQRVTLETRSISGVTIYSAPLARALSVADQESSEGSEGESRGGASGLDTLELLFLSPRPNQLVITIAPRALVERQVKRLSEGPAQGQSMREAKTFQRAMDTAELDGGWRGWLSLERAHATVVSQWGERAQAMMSSACLSDAGRLISAAPELLAGERRGSTQALPRSRFLWRFAPQVSAVAQKLHTQGLYSAALGNSLLSLELGVNLSGVQEVMQALVSYLRAEPLTCEPFKRVLNAERVEFLLTQSRLAPPMFLEVKGVSVAVHHADLEGHLAASVIASAAQMPLFMAMLQFLPQLSRVNFPTLDAPPQALRGLKRFRLPKLLSPIYAQLRADALGVAVGVEGASALERALSPRAPEATLRETPLLGIEYNVEGLNTLLSSVGLATPRDPKSAPQSKGLLRKMSALKITPLGLSLEVDTHRIDVVKPKPKPPEPRSPESESEPKPKP